MAAQPCVSLIGPSHPYRGGIVDHTMELARRLRTGGFLGEYAAWGRQFPRRVHPTMAGEIRTAGSQGIIESDSGPTSRGLHWDRPMSWRRTGERLGNNAQRLVLVVSSPLQVPAIRAISKGFRSTAAMDSRVILIVHNVIPHEARPWDGPFMRLVLRSGDAAIVHSEDQARLARRLGARRVICATLPLHPPAGFTASRHPAGSRRLGTLGFFGMIREYKGLRALLQALAVTSTEPRLIVQGEFWEPIADYRRLIAQLGLEERVVLRPGFAPADQLASSMADVDAVVLPYSSGTGTQQPRVAFLRGLPVIATDFGDIQQQIRNRIDGLIVQESDPAILGAAIDDFYSDSLWLKLRDGVKVPNSEAEWSQYLDYILSA